MDKKTKQEQERKRLINKQIEEKEDKKRQERYSKWFKNQLKTNV